MNLMALEGPRQPQLVNEAGVDAAVWKKAVEGLNQYFRRWDEDIKRNYAARYVFKFVRLQEHWSEDIYTWNYELLEAVPFYGPIQSWSRKKRVFKLPRERVVEEIPQRDDWVYRGMSWEEWQNTRRTKTIQSRGTYNIGEGQKGLTLFGNRAEQARYYATGFAPPGFKPAKRRPGVIIAIPKELTVGHEAKGVMLTEDERGLVGSAPLDVIEAVWFAIPTETTDGMLELVWRKSENTWTTGSAWGANTSHALMQVYP
jgi:hypothetical protein